MIEHGKGSPMPCKNNVSKISEKRSHPLLAGLGGSSLGLLGLAGAALISVRVCQGGCLPRVVPQGVQSRSETPPPSEAVLMKS